MFKRNTLKACLLISAIVLYLNVNGALAEPCPSPDCPPNISTIPGTVQYPADWIFEWDPSNPQEINRDSSVTVNVIGGYAPYTWSVSGTGFSLADSQTQGLSNTLIVDNTACGPAFVTVADSRNSQPVAGSLRTLGYGQWVAKGPICGLAGEYDSRYYDKWAGANIYTKVQGYQKQTQKVDQMSNKECGALNCESICTWYDDYNYRCNPTYGCETCIAGNEALCFGNYCMCTMLLNYYEYECL